MKISPGTSDEKLTQKQKAIDVFNRLHEEYPDARCTVDFYSPEKFLFSNIISPQCPDTTANRVAKTLWVKYKTPENLAHAKLSDIEKIVKPCGFFRVKSRHVLASAKLLKSRFNGVLPSSLNELMKFPGIGRKTGLVILSEAFGKTEGIVIDTHNIRLARRLDLTSKTSATDIEKDLIKLLPKKYWRLWSNLMVAHGRKICTARNPKCKECNISRYCEFIKSQ